MGAEKYVVAYGMNRHEVRRLLHDRQDGLCGICEDDLPKEFLHSRWVNIDHRIPRSHGGLDRLDNVQLTHLLCNLAKADSCPGCDGCPE